MIIKEKMLCDFFIGGILLSKILFSLFWSGVVCRDGKIICIVFVNFLLIVCLLFWFIRGVFRFLFFLNEIEVIFF